jgi:hypothetical protein
VEVIGPKVIETPLIETLLIETGGGHGQGDRSR